jgi:anti-sigma B factor antagonist
VTDFEATLVDSGATVIKATGRLDMIAAPMLKSLVTLAVSRGETPLVIDLTCVEFMDSSGIGALVSGLRTSRQANSDLRIAGAKAQVLSVLELTNISRVLHPYDSVDEALSAG